MSEGSVIFYADRMQPLEFPGGFGTPDPDSGLFLAKQGVEGWYSTPDLKVTLTERGQGDGAHDVQVSDILYSARTVTVHWVVSQWTDRARMVECFNRVSGLAGRWVKLRVIDSISDTFVEGYVSVQQTDTQWSADWNGGDGDNTVTVVCPRPERRGWAESTSQIFPTRTGGEGLYFGEAMNGKCPGLVLSPVQFGGETHLDSRNRCILWNDGTFQAYPTFTLTGTFDSGVRLEFTDRTLVYSGPVRKGYPVLLDSRSRTATCNGIDVSQYVTERGWPVVPPLGATICTLTSAGDGWVTCTTRDTYM